MDNEPQGQAGKRVIDSFSFKIADMTIETATTATLSGFYSPHTS